LDERGTTSRAGCALGKPRWTTGDRRTDAFVVLLVIAGSVAPTVVYVVNLCSSGRFWPPESVAGTLGVRLLLRWLAWAAWGPAAVVPLLIGLAALLRFCAVRPAVIAATACLVLTAFAKAAAGVAFAFDHKAQGITLMPTFWLFVGHRAFGALAPCVVPLAVLLVICLADAATGCPKRVGARLTRVLLGVQGAVQVVWTVAWRLVGTGSTQGAPTWSASAAQVLGLSSDLLIILWGIALVVCAWRLVVCDRVSRRIIWTATAVQAAAWSLMATLWTATMTVFEGFPETSFLAGVLISRGSPLVGSAFIVWYWWPVLRGRASPALDPDVPHCTRCGYNLTGNVSGVCPECGTPVTLVLPAHT
jgi:hypothetical protein